MHRRLATLIVLLLACGAIALAIGAWVTAERRACARAVPPRGVTGFESFLNWRESVRRFEVLRRADEEYLLAITPGGRLLSGPSGYVFDRGGRRLDWSPDVMDHATFQRKWEPTLRRDRDLTAEEARAWSADLANGWADEG